MFTRIEGDFLVFVCEQEVRRYTNYLNNLNKEIDEQEARISELKEQRDIIMFNIETVKAALGGK